jgi:hypothetical protein
MAFGVGWALSYEGISLIIEKPSLKKTGFCCHPTGLSFTGHQSAVSDYTTKTPHFQVIESKLCWKVVWLLVFIIECF